MKTQTQMKPRVVVWCNIQVVAAARIDDNSKADPVWADIFQGLLL